MNEQKRTEEQVPTDQKDREPQGDERASLPQEVGILRDLKDPDRRRDT